MSHLSRYGEPRSRDRKFEGGRREEEGEALHTHMSSLFRIRTYGPYVWW